MIQAASTILAVGLAILLSVDAGLRIDIKDADTHSLTLNWTVDTNTTIKSYKISVDDLSPEYKITYTGEKFIHEDIQEAIVRVHEPDTAYNVCMIALADKGMRFDDCITGRTIKMIQMSSLVAVIAVILFFVISILIGTVSWKLATRKMNMKRKVYLTDANGNGDTVHLTKDVSSSIEAEA